MDRTKQPFLLLSTYTKHLVVSPEDRAAFTPIIDRILRASNLEQISAKKVRNGLAAALSGRDLSDQKVRIAPWHFVATS